MSILVISEKPSAARKIADALSGGKARTMGKGKVKYLEFVLEGQPVRVAAAVGHIYGLKQKVPGGAYPVFDIEWAPSHEIQKGSDYTKDYLSVLKTLCKESDEVVNACDLDTEGSLIGFKVIQFNAPSKKSSRMKFSTLTSAELKKAFDARGPLDVSMAQAGEARHELDWLWGINASRALMAAIKKAGIFRILSIGRVQGPALHVLATREKEIAAFKPEPYWQLFARLGEAEFEHIHGKFFVQGEADAAFGRSSKDGTVQKVEATKVKQKPPFPFDLTTLQMEAYRCFSFSPTQTLQFAQDLYSEAWISYPRTSSQQLPAQLGLDRIVMQMAQQPQYAALANQLVAEKRFLPNNGPKDDPAHPAIHPTGEKPGRIGVPQAKLYDLIVKRFLATLAPEAKRIKMNVVLHLGQEDYAAQGARTVEPGWHAFYAPYTKVEEVTLPALTEGNPVTVDNLEKVQKETQPPKRFTAASIIKALEAKNLGTKATRASIVQTLFDRAYLTGKSIQVTPLGLQVETALEKNVPEILSEGMTRQFEEEMEAIEGQTITKEKVVQDGRQELEKILLQFKDKEGPIGQELVSALKQTQSSANVLGPCKACGKSLAIRKSQYGFFVGCTGYPACKMLYPLPKEALIKPLGKICESCGTPQVSVHRKGKRSFTMCLDPKCKTKENWGPKPAAIGSGPSETGGAVSPGVRPSVASTSSAPSASASALVSTTSPFTAKRPVSINDVPSAPSVRPPTMAPASGLLKPVLKSAPVTKPKRKPPAKKPTDSSQARIDYGD
ncbi:DNA topoisomerase I [Candidatus Micrarchaeota archaeon]|nr:DNA topoisomerase I [Candidatus Micrarchaeota archaeon]